jgi:hypothetical protein
MGHDFRTALSKFMNPDVASRRKVVGPSGVLVAVEGAVIGFGRRV